VASVAEVKAAIDAAVQQVNESQAALYAAKEKLAEAQQSLVAALDGSASEAVGAAHGAGATALAVEQAQSYASGL
jgi:ethanolamine utilization microcompartment shell protein EutL